MSPVYKSMINKSTIILMAFLVVLICQADVSAQRKIRVIGELDRATISSVRSEPQPTKTTDSKEDPNIVILKQKGVEPTFEGIKKYLQEIHITDEQKKQAIALIELLGSEDYQIRQEATKKLALFPGLPIEQFEKAKEDSDVETVYRIEMVARFLNVSFGKHWARLTVLSWIKKSPA